MTGRYRFVVVTVLAVLGYGSETSADVGRLFFSQPERAALERSRHEAEVEPRTVTAPVAPEPTPLLREQAPELRPTITVDGYVRRSNGETTLWVNGENSYDGNAGANRAQTRTIHLRGGRVAVTPEGERTPVLLKPGQSYDPNSATTADLYEATPAIGKIAP